MSKVQLAGGAVPAGVVVDATPAAVRGAADARSANIRPNSSEPSALRRRSISGTSTATRSMAIVLARTSSLPILASIVFAEASGVPSLRRSASPSMRAVPASVTALGTLPAVTNASLSRVVSAPPASFNPCGSGPYSTYWASRSASTSMSSVAS